MCALQIAAVRIRTSKNSCVVQGVKGDVTTSSKEELEKVVSEQLCAYNCSVSVPKLQVFCNVHATSSTGQTQTILLGNEQCVVCNEPATLVLV